MNPLFRDLSPEEQKEFRDWTRINYTPHTKIKGIWHPIVKDECGRINAYARKQERVPRK